MRAPVRSVVAGALAAVVLGVGATAAQASQRPVRIGPGGAQPGIGGAGSDTAIYVDPAGTAHVAVVAADQQTVDLCTIPLGATACADRSVLATDALSYGGAITSIKYLPDRSSTGHGLADLAVGMYNLVPNPPPFNPGEQAPYSETELFTPGSSNGLATGDAYADPAGLGEGGDEILAPDASGVDVVGLDQAGTPFGTVHPANAYEFESLISPSSADSTPVLLGVSSAQVQGGPWPFDVTELPGGQTAVLAATFTTYRATPSRIGMYVQPAAGGAFGPLRQLGISGTAEADFSPGDSYVLNVETSALEHPRTFGDGLGANMELYAFRGTSLHQLAAVGFATDLSPSAFGWADLPPSYADANGNLYVAWLTRGSYDGCPDALRGGNSAPYESGCLMYRRIAPGGLLGPKIVLSTQASPDALVDGPSPPVAGLGAMAVNDNGVGWVLVSRGNSSTGVLYAQPLVSSSEPTGSPTTSGATVSVPLACSGAPGTSCPVAAELLTPGSAATITRRLRRRRVGHPGVYGASALTLSSGHRTSLRLRLNPAGRRLLARRHRLALTLVVTEKVGANPNPTLVLARAVSFGR